MGMRGAAEDAHHGGLMPTRAGPTGNQHGFGTEGRLRASRAPALQKVEGKARGVYSPMAMKVAASSHCTVRWNGSTHRTRFPARRAERRQW